MLKRKLLAMAVMALGASQVQAAGEAKNVIFFLGDGMGPTTVTAARIYSVGEDGKLTMDTLARTARLKTFSEDAQTTDSAPSMAAYMTGVKMKNEVLSMQTGTVAFKPTADLTSDCDKALNNGKKGVDTLLEMAKAKGLATGVVTTTRITHATPAATYSHVCHRDAESDIAAQLVPGGSGTGYAAFNAKLGEGVDVVLGGGKQFFVPKADGGKRADGRNLIDEMKAKGYTFVAKGSELAAVDTNTTGKLFGLFNNSHMNYELDRKKNSIDEPSLADMTKKAIDILAKKNPNGYFLMVEGGRIDHALHDTNAKRALEDTVAFDAAIKAALGKVDLKNTLIVVTADHDHTMTFNGYTKRTGATTDANPGILGLSKSYKDGTPNYDTTGKTSTTLVFGNGGGNRPTVRADVLEADAAADGYHQEVGVQTKGGFGSETHGGGDVMLFADGAGAKSFKGTLENIKVFGLVKAALGF